MAWSYHTSIPRMVVLIQDIMRRTALLSADSVPLADRNLPPSFFNPGWVSPGEVGSYSEPGQHGSSYTAPDPWAGYMAAAVGSSAYSAHQAPQTARQD